MSFFCTYFDHRYAEQGLAMISSLTRFEKKAVVWVLALTEECEALLLKMALPAIQVVPLRVLLKKRPALEKVRNRRGVVEFYFTANPVFVRFCLEKIPTNQLLTKLDSDLYFYQSPRLIRKREEGHSVVITPHRFPARLRDRERFGKFNVGWVSIRNDRAGRACARDWERQCLDWCHDRPEPGRYADQKYLDAWPSRHQRVKVLKYPGANLASWNVGEADLSWDGSKVKVNGEPLVFYHFSGLRRMTDRVFDPQWSQNDLKPSRILVQRVYRPYLAALQAARKSIGVTGESAESLRYGETGKKTSPPGFWKRWRRVLRGDYLRD
ncbi:MAG: hypothetical protein EB090_04165 [Verrucomicrobia bacterium]|nr:hypothetical protein [Verrucomicrobiota bacterium]